MTDPTVRRADVLILGGGVAGCVLAARLSEDPSRQVLLVEAGPDYGAPTATWPESLRTADTLPRDHVWERDVPMPRVRGKVLGGSSAVNGCWHTWGSAADHRAWQTVAGDLFSWATLAPHRDRAIATMGLVDVDPAEITVWGRAALDAAAEACLPWVDMARPGPLGRGTPLVNSVDGLRVNAAMAYLDERVRRRPNLTVVGRALVDRLLITGDRISAVRVLTDAGELMIGADQVVLSCGTLGSPAVLLRSGIGPAGQLGELGIEPVLDRPGVGANLSDQPGSFVPLPPTPELNRELAAQGAAGPLYSTRALVRAASSHAPADGWDLHLLPVAGRPLFGQLPPGQYEAGLSVQVLSPTSRGTVRITTTDPAVPPNVDPGFLTDPDGCDAAVLREGLALVDELAEAPPLRRWWGSRPSPADRSDEALRARLGCYWHPVGTCAAGRDDDPGAVVDPTLRLRGLSNLHVVDASVLPTAPAANTQLTVLALAELAAAELVSGGAGA